MNSDRPSLSSVATVLSLNFDFLVKPNAVWREKILVLVLSSMIFEQGCDICCQVIQPVFYSIVGSVRTDQAKLVEQYPGSLGRRVA